MLEPIRDDVDLVQSLNHIRDTQKIPLIDYNSDLDDLLDKVGRIHTDLIRYLPGIMKIRYYQGLILQYYE